MTGASRPGQEHPVSFPVKDHCVLKQGMAEAGWRGRGLVHLVLARVGAARGAGALAGREGESAPAGNRAAHASAHSEQTEQLTAGYGPQTSHAGREQSRAVL